MDELAIENLPAYEQVNAPIIEGEDCECACGCGERFKIKSCTDAHIILIPIRQHPTCSELVETTVIVPRDEFLRWFAPVGETATE